MTEEQTDATPGGEPRGREAQVTFAAERAKTFIDAVVAIAMTLLILPLMESVGDLTGKDATAAHWFSEHETQLIMFALSFVMVAMFWMEHHSLFVWVERITTPFLWITVAWLFTIAWLPVATALIGQTRRGDTPSELVYIGSLFVTSLVILIQRVYLRLHPELHTMPRRHDVNGMAAGIATTVLFLVAAGIAVAIPSINYWALGIMMLSGPLQSVVARAIGSGSRRRAGRPEDRRRGGS